MRKAKTDANQQEIVGFLRKAGCSTGCTYCRNNYASRLRVVSYE